MVEIFEIYYFSFDLHFLWQTSGPIIELRPRFKAFAHNVGRGMTCEWHFMIMHNILVKSQRDKLSDVHYYMAIYICIFGIRYKGLDGRGNFPNFL